MVATRWNRVRTVALAKVRPADAKWYEQALYLILRPVYVILRPVGVVLAWLLDRVVIPAALSLVVAGLVYWIMTGQHLFGK